MGSKEQNHKTMPGIRSKPAYDDWSGTSKLDLLFQVEKKFQGAKEITEGKGRMWLGKEIVRVEPGGEEGRMAAFRM